MTQCNSTEVLVVGGGVVGLSAAIAMRARGFKTLVLDKNAIQHATQRVYALNTASINLLKSLQVWQHLDASLLSPYRQMHIWDAANHATLDFAAQTLGKSELGYIIEEDLLKIALLKQCAIDEVRLVSQTEVQHLTQTPDTIIVHADEQTFSTQFLLITDGAESSLRKHLNIPMTTWPYHQHALVTTVRTERAHLKSAYQVFTEDGPLAFLPLNHPHECSIVWSTSQTKTNALMALSDEAFNAMLTTAFENKLGACTLINKRQHFPLHMRHAQKYHGNRWILMGDAAHTIHPLAGLGLNLGLADLNAWLNLIDKHKKALHTSRILDAYQRSRKHAVWQVIALMEVIKMTFANPLSPLQYIRGLGLNTINRLSPLKRLFMTYAAGE